MSSDAPHARPSNARWTRNLGTYGTPPRTRGARRARAGRNRLPLEGPRGGGAPRGARGEPLSPRGPRETPPLRRRQRLRRVRGGRLERHGLSSPTPSVDCAPTSELSPMAFLVGVRLVASAADTPRVKPGSSPGQALDAPNMS